MGGAMGGIFGPFSYEFAIISTFLTILVSFWRHFWDIQASFWPNSSIILCHFGIIFGFIWGSIQDNFDTNLASIWNDFGIILE